MSVMPPRVMLLSKREPESAGNSAPQAVRPSPVALVPAAPAPRRRGRPPLSTPDQAIEEIRAEANAGRLVRVHLERPALYARARRLWGSWAGALAAAGFDPKGVLEAARQRALETRRRRRADELL